MNTTTAVAAPGRPVAAHWSGAVAPGWLDKHAGRFQWRAPGRARADRRALAGCWR